jgi:stage V sporulation protein D (sporulation-specific penicillin-binding protein)
MITASMALEEGIATESSTYTCEGFWDFRRPDVDPIHCWVREPGHGTETLVDGVCNSCNPYMIWLGQNLGRYRFFNYFEAFGFTEKTGVDLPGESGSLFYTADQLNLTELATESFGQNFSITPIQMITACASVANGGYVLEPHVVSKITDADGNVIKSVEKKIKRQVVSKETSDKMNEILAYNTATAGSTAGYVAGYKVAGKTGTSEKIGAERISHFSKDYIASFCGYAPADDPQIAMLVFFDTPDGDAYYGSQVSSPVFVNIMNEVLPYLEVKTQYSDDELQYIDVAAGDYTGISVADAQAKAEADGFTTTVKGEGETVVAQIPTVSSKIQNGGNIVLYTDSTSASQTVTVPSLIGLTVSQVNSVASAYGLNASFEGAGSTQVISISQDIEPGTQVGAGTVITVKFASSTTLND